MVATTQDQILQLLYNHSLQTHDLQYMYVHDCNIHTDKKIRYLRGHRYKLFTFLSVDMVDWLVDWLYLTSSEPFFSYIQDERKQLNATGLEIRKGDGYGRII